MVWNWVKQKLGVRAAYFILGGSLVYFAIAAAFKSCSTEKPQKPKITATSNLENKITKFSKVAGDFTKFDLKIREPNLRDITEIVDFPKEKIAMKDPLPKSSKIYRFAHDYDLLTLINQADTLWKTEHKDNNNTTSNLFYAAYINYIEQEHFPGKSKKADRLSKGRVIIDETFYKDLKEDKELWENNTTGERKRKELIKKFWNNDSLYKKIHDSMYKLKDAPTVSKDSKTSTPGTKPEHKIFKSFDYSIEYFIRFTKGTQV